ncbi:MAG TPA: hypothetical protein VKE74_07905, partial [Gemmataceae bacterium]|nr:hypothetical protein [Gemmataceae bacterium]
AAAGLIGVGVVLAGDEKPTPVPTKPAKAAPPMTPEVAPRPELPDWAKDEARRKAIVAAGRQQAGAEPAILIDALCVKVPSAFCEQCGLDDGPGTAGPWVLSQRESRMFTALLRAEPGKEVISRPQIIASNNQAAVFQVGQEVPYAVVEPPKDGGDPPVTKLESKSVGVTLRVTPRLSADGRSIRLHTEAQSTQLGAPVDLGRGVTSPVFHTQSSQATVVVPDAGTVVVRTGTTTTGTVVMLRDGTKQAGKKETIDELWVLTAHIVRAADEKPAAAPKPAPFSNGGVPQSKSELLPTFNPGQSFNANVGPTDVVRAFALTPAEVGANIERSLSKFDARWITSMQWQKVDQPVAAQFLNFQQQRSPMTAVQPVSTVKS